MQSFLLERQYILQIYLYDSGWLWKKYLIWWFTELENTILLQNNDGNCETGIEFLSLKHSYI